MSKPAPDPHVADLAPDADVLTGYDQQHLVTYLRLLDAEAQGADWTEVARSCCASILRKNPSERDASGKATWRAPGG